MNTKDLIDRLLGLPSSLLIGSRAFEVNDNNSDYDICVLRSELDDITKGLVETNIRNYFNILPLNNSSLVRLNDVDIIIYDNIEDIRIVYLAKLALLKLPKYMLKDKDIRVKLFEMALLNYGFVEQSMNCLDNEVIQF